MRVFLDWIIVGRLRYKIEASLTFFLAGDMLSSRTELAVVDLLFD